MGKIEFCHIVFCYEIPDKSRPVCWSIVMKEKPAVRSPFFVAFHSDRTPKATKDVSVNFLIHTFTFKDRPRSEFRELTEATTYVCMYVYIHKHIYIHTYIHTYVVASKSSRNYIYIHI